MTALNKLKRYIKAQKPNPTEILLKINELMEDEKQNITDAWIAGNTEGWEYGRMGNVKRLAERCS